MPIKTRQALHTVEGNGKRKREAELLTSNSYEVSDQPSGEDELDSLSDHSDTRKQQGKGKGKAVADKTVIDDTVLENHRSVCRCD